MRSIKKLLALVLAAALVAGTMSVGFAALENPIKAFSEPLNAQAAGVSSVNTVVVSPNPATVEKSKTQKFSAKVMTGVSGVATDVTPSWSVVASKPDGAAKHTNTAIGTNGVLMVSAAEKATELVVTATVGDKQGTATVTLTEKPVHLHTKECLSASLNYSSGDSSGRGKYVSMDISEPAPKSDYFDLSVYCTTNDAMNLSTKVSLEVTGELQEILSASEPAVKNYNAENTGYITYAARLLLKEGKQVQGALTVPLTLTVDGVKFELTAALYAEKADPMYTKGTAVFTLDLKDLQEKYTSTPVKLNIPGGVRTVANVEAVDYYGKPHKNISAKLTGDDLVLELRRQDTEYSKSLDFGNSQVSLKVTFKARTSPLLVTIPMETTVVNEVVTLDYTKELQIPENSSTNVTAKVTEDFADDLQVSNNISISMHSQGGSFRTRYDSENGISIVAEGPGTALFDASVNVHGAIGVDKDKVAVNFRYVVKDNPLSAAGEGDAKVYYLWTEDTLRRHIDLNVPAAYAKQFIVYADSKDVTVTKVELAEMLSSGGSYDQSGIAADFFEFSAKPAAADGKMPVVLTLKNSKDVTLTASTMRPVLNVTLSDGKTAELKLYIPLIAGAPAMTAHDYKTGERITTDGMTVGQSKKYTIKSNDAKNYASANLYVNNSFMTVVRGNAFYNDFGVSEVVTLRLDKAYSDKDYVYLDSSVRYTPNVTNEKALVTVSGDNWIYNEDLIVFSGGGSPTDPEDTDPSNPGGGDSGSGGGSGAGSGNTTNNTANTPATTDKVQQALDAVKGLGAITADKLPAGVTLNTTAGGASIATIPVKLTTGNAGLGTDLLNTLGAGSSKVGLELTISSGTASGSSSVKIIIPGGFGKVTEPGRFNFPMDFKEKCEDSAKMLKAVKGENAVSAAMQIGGNFTLPVAATITVKSTAPEGSTVNIYKYDPLTGKYTTIGKAKVVKGQLTFATKLMGQMLFTTGTI